MAHVLTIAAYLSAATILLAFVNRRVFKPVRTAAAKLALFADQLEHNAELAMQLTQLAGAMTNLAVAQQDRNADTNQRLADLVELVVDMTADVGRLQRDVARLQMTA